MVRVHEFKYQGSTIQSNGQCTREEKTDLWQKDDRKSERESLQDGSEIAKKTEEVELEVVDDKISMRGDQDGQN